METERHDYDVIVVGKGNAALCSALSAREHGVRVAILEAAPEAMSGGNSRYAGTPPAIVERLNGLIVSILKTPAAGDFFQKNAMWEPMPMSSAQVADFIRSEIAVWHTAVTQAGIEAQ